jgi:hypothetical protein
VPPRRLDILPRRIDSGHLRAEPRQRLAQQSRPAADVKSRLSCQRPDALDIAAPVQVDRLADEVEPHRVHPVEHRRAAFGVPPVLRLAAEMRRFLGPDGCSCDSCIVHGVHLTARDTRFQQERRARGPHRDEIRRHLDGRDRAHPPRGADRPQAAGGRTRGGGSGLGDGRRDRPAGQFLPRGQRALRPGGVRRGGRQRRAGHRRAAGADAAGDGLQGALVARLASADPHGRSPCQGPRRGDRRRVHGRGDAGGRDRGNPGLPGPGR